MPMPDCQAPPPLCAHEGEPQATITRSRFGYWVNVTWGISGLTAAPWFRWTRWGAERKARRTIAWWKAGESRETWMLP
jgi:hypothetical protein